MHMAQEKGRPLHLPFARYEHKPSLAWARGAVMERRRRQHDETADQRLDRLIEMERRPKLEVPQMPEVRLKVNEGTWPLRHQSHDKMNVEDKVELKDHKGR